MSNKQDVGEMLGGLFMNPGETVNIQKESKESVRKTFKEAALEIAEILEQKNKDYGSAYAHAGKFLQILYPDGIRPEQYTNMLLITRIFDKLCRIASGADEKEPYFDISGYGILGYTKAKK